MINHYNHPAGLRGLCQRGSWSGVTEKLTQPGNLFDAKIVRVRMFEERSLCSHDKNRLIPAVILYLADVTDEFYRVRPAEITRELACEKAFVEQIKIVAEVCTHSFSMAVAPVRDCIALLTVKRLRRCEDFGRRLLIAAKVKANAVQVGWSSKSICQLDPRRKRTVEVLSMSSIDALLSAGFTRQTFSSSQAALLL
jgi:hypothetical protein